MPQASTWFDLVVGLDIHYEVVPGSPAPVPFPHPFLGLVFDPVGLVAEEMISEAVAWATDTPRTTGPVLINGKLATVTGDEAKMPTGHLLIPPGVSWFPMPKIPMPGGKGPSLPEPPAPPPGDALMAFGSKTVEMRGGKAVRLGDPALSCSDPVRLPTSFVIPSGGPGNVMVGGPTAIDWVVVGLAAGFRALRTKKISKLAHAAVERFIPKNWKRARDFLHDAACFVTGHPVNVVNGSMFTTWSDFELPGPIPLSFTRRYRSSFCDRDSVLGYGWSHNLDQRVWIEPDTVVYLTEDGRELEFDTWHLPDHVARQGDEIFDPISRFTLRSLGGFRWEVESPGGIVREFAPIGGGSTEDRGRGLSRLVRIRNRGGDETVVRYDDRAHLAEVVDSGGRTIRFDHDRDGHLEQIWLPAADGSGLRPHARFSYSPDGDLVEAQDALDQPVRFEYDRHTLVKETNRNGLSFHFVYDGWGPFARCVRTWGDGQIHDHEITYDIEGRRTIVEDSIGYATVYEWGAHGTVTKIIDARGGETCFEYDALTRKIAATDPLGHVTRYAYDERGNRTMIAGPDGAATKIRYDERDNPIWLSTPKGAQWQWSYDRWGRRVAEINPLGQRTKYTYEHGRLVAIEDPAGRRTCLGYDSGNVVHLVNPDRTERKWSYDALGRVASATDVGGNVQRREHDALGRVVRINEADGNVRVLEYDAEGNVTRARDHVRDLEFGYCGMNRIAWRRIAGTTVRFEYDKEERLTAFVNEAGHAYRFERDALGRVKTETCYDGSRRRYERDAAGRVTKVLRPGVGRFSSFEYDVSNRLTRTTHHDGTVSTFAYDRDGALVEASNETVKVRFERDEIGRVTKEHQGDQWIATQYDCRGLRIGAESSLGAAQTIHRNETGEVIGVVAKHYGLTWQADIERDTLGHEIHREVSGGLRSYRWRDQRGKVQQQWIGRDKQAAYRRRYKWTRSQRLSAIETQGKGETRYQHDTRGYLTSTTHPSGEVSLRVPDAVGNLFHRRDKSDRSFGPTGELLSERTSAGERQFRYDSEGNLITRKEPNGDLTRYTWDGSGRLIRAMGPRSGDVHFRYDALGRRYEKRCNGNGTRWIWKNGQPIHEVLSVESDAAGGGSEHVVTWVFEPGRHVPSARMARSAQSVIFDHLGSPLVVANASGEVEWSEEQASTEFMPWGYPGQYYDDETGLSYNGHRYFDPMRSLYISRDPIGLRGGERLYGYCRDPLISIDPFGLTSQKDYSVSFFGQAVVPFVDTPGATLGRPGGIAWLMPIEDAAKLRNSGDIARHTGMAESNAIAFVNRESIFGVSVPSASLDVRKPTVEDSGGWEHFLPGGNTAVRLPGENGGFLVNPTREVVTPGGNPMPPDTVLFEVDENGAWIPIRRF